MRIQRDLDFAKLTYDERLSIAAHFLLSKLPDELWQECSLIACLDPDMGLRFHPAEDDDRLDVVWANRFMGSISGEWARTGKGLPPS